MAGVGRRLGVMGGTFDPIHYGHLVTAEEALVQFALDAVVFVPTGHPWMKQGRVVSPAEDRYLMTVIATASNPRFQVSRIEIDRDGPTYVVDTLRTLSADNPDAELYFIAATRPGYDLARFEAAGPARDASVSMMTIPALAISSTDIRERIRDGRPIRYLVPEGVKSYVEKAALYR